MPRIECELPDAVDATVDHLDVTVEGPEGTVSRRLWYPDVSVSIEDVPTESDEDTVDAVVIESEESDAETRATLGTFESHVENMIHGVQESWTYEMEVYYSHFPMQVSVEGDDVVIENFLGEAAPRRTAIHGDTTVEVEEDRITLSGPNIEDVGQTAADIEQLTRVTDKDARVFQDGVYITEKPSRGEV
ncbi:50S ribosomal protein L6 [Halococcoides cellulosivorans]|uniref:50S ribosomal protein L6 n=1 Tax=Halococcoides cellulosivorans TaxID=1679096 RepID=A0A2R4X2A3_9EURY|nr:50S ribosomal protein L6 [Halococcoides cellulosivorans]AWB27918.1 50S ribosomal protein L6 [Halococcoides cellulosivorans]